MGGTGCSPLPWSPAASPARSPRPALRGRCTAVRADLKAMAEPGSRARCPGLYIRIGLHAPCQGLV